MRKVALVLAVVFGLGLFAGATASAEPVCTELGCTGVNEEGYIVVADGAIGNPDPFDGYIGVTDDGTVACSDTGGPYSEPDPTTPHSPTPCGPPA